ncbi:MAG: hypothetical protein KDC80_10415 [Saprospiraceae bacterium]|nr:hypothetical protein [Saprospiraceae bacterium]
MNKQAQFEQFLALSSAITGYNRLDLLGTGVAWDYFSTINEIVGEVICLDLWLEIQKILSENLEETKIDLAIRLELLSSEKFGPVVRNLIKLWYLGQWDELPSGWRQHFGQSTRDINFIISASSYKSGLIWDAIGAHPMGARQTGFGTWSHPPRPPEFD